MRDVPGVIGRYEVERLLGEGGMGVLYLARDPVIDRHVALKLLRVNGEDLRRRFVREAQSAGRLQHPNIVTVYDVGDQEGQLYIAMEYIDGDTLAVLIRDNVPFSPIRKLDIIDEVADGLGYAHQRGIIHRDIKPANLMISRAGLVKVLDFGIARFSHRESCEIDAPTLIGTPAYMAPEQLEGAEVDARSDIYAVGLVMYELFSGRRAFAGATTADVLQKVLAAQPTPIEQLVPDIDAELARVIARAMERQPRDRYQDLQSMRKDLARARRRAMQASADDATIVVGVPITGPVTTQVPPEKPPATVVPTPTPPTSSVRTQEDVALAHLAAQRTTRPAPPPQPALDETVFAPVGQALQPPPTSPVAVSTPPPAPPAPAAPVVPPPLPVPPTPVAPVAQPASTAPSVASSAPVDEGPLPVPLPAVPSSGVFPIPSGGRATVDAPVIAAAREKAASEIGSGPVRLADEAAPRASSAPRAAFAAPPPVASPGAVQPLSTPVPTARRGLPAVVVVAAMVAALGVMFLVAYVAVRTLGRAGGSVGSLFSRTVEPKVAQSVQPPSTTTTADNRTAQQTEPGTTSSTTQGTEVPVSTTEPTQAETVLPPGGQPPAEQSGTSNQMVTQPPVTEPAKPPVTQPPVTRPRQSVQQPQERSAESPRTVEGPRQVTQSVVDPPPSRLQERREPEPPPVQAPDEEGIALVRAYVAARNTAHASGIRRVWPGVDDNHLRRVTSSFSAPLTLSRCVVAARDASHATATCQLTQPGTTGAYAQGHGLTIRRTFVFDLVRQGRVWVIAGLTE